MASAKNILHHVRGVLIVSMPVAVFGIVYVLLGVWPNYLFADVDTEGVYNLEKSLFGIVSADGRVLTPSEYFRLNHWAVADILSGVFYMLWIPLPLIYALVLYFQRRTSLALRLTSAFLTVNLLGFAIYYAFPASPPWYVMDYGLGPVRFGTPGSEAGFANFDRLVGISFFHNYYCHNANVFAAVPSLHSAYNPVALIYALMVPRNWKWQAVLGLVSVGVCLSAVYSGHHYIIDVVLGVLVAIVGTALFERLIHIDSVRENFNKIINITEHR